MINSTLATLRDSDAAAPLPALSVKALIKTADWRARSWAVALRWSPASTLPPDMPLELEHSVYIVGFADSPTS